MKYCYDCGDVLTEQNRSREHIINNCIGGRLKSYDLLCRTCNSIFGNSMDVAVSKAFNLLANQLDLPRDYGSTQDEVGELISGEKIVMSPGGKPKLCRTTVQSEEVNGKIQISVSAPNTREAEKALRGIQRKHKLSDEQIAEIRTKMTPQKYKIDEQVKLSLQIGGNDLFKALTKMGINFYIWSGGLPQFIKSSLSDIKMSEKCDLVWFFNDSKKSFKYDERQISHSVHLNGCPDKKILYCVLDLFSVAQYLIVLNSDYAGARIENTYSFDLLKQQEVKQVYEYQLQRDEVLNLISKREYDYERIKERMIRFGNISQNLNYFGRKAEEITSKYFNKYKDTDYVKNPELFTSHFSHFVANELLPEIQAASNNRREKAEASFLKNKTSNESDHSD